MTDAKRKTKQDKTILYSIIIPTYRECLNLSPLITRVFDALKISHLNSNTELIVIDDNSNDGSEQEIEKLAQNYPVRIIVRRKERGLSSAVLHGFNEAKGSLLLCMDADLQHPPEKVPEMLKCLQGDVEFVLGTRYGGKEFSVDKDWPLYRQVISKGARLLARPLTPLSDPMSGFFGITKEAYKRAKDVNEVGFKIALELYVKSGVRKHKEVPIVFGLRTAGESKLTGKVIVHYLRHLVLLFSFLYPMLPVIVVLLILVVLYVLYTIIF